MDIEEVLLKLKSNEYKVIDNTTREAQLMQSAFAPMCLDNLLSSNLNYVSLEPYDFEVDDGLKLSYYVNTSITNTPFKIDYIDDYIAIADRGIHKISLFSEDFNLKKYYKTTIETYDDSHPICFCSDDENIYIGTQYNRILALKKDTKEKLWSFGKKYSRGSCADDVIGRVTNMQMLPNGNIIMSTYDGAGSEGNLNGTVEEFDNQGNYVKTHLQYISSGEGSDNETRYPLSIRVYDDIVYVGKSDSIDVFRYDDENSDLEYVDTIRKPSNSNIDDLGLYDFVIKGDIIYIVAPNMKKVVGFNMVTGAVEFSVGCYDYEAYSGFIHKGNAMNYPVGICVMNDDKIIVCDSSNKSVVQIFRDDYIHPKYDVPQNINVISSSASFDDDGRVSTPVGEKPNNLQIVYTKNI